MAEKIEERTCQGCPSYLTTREAAVFFKKSVGSAMCARYGKPLERPSATPEENKRSAAFIGSKCESYGRPRPSTVTVLETEVVLPDPASRVELSPTSPDRTLVATCAQCVHQVPEDVVEEHLGWTAAICAAKGRLLMGNRKVAEAKGCDFKQAGRGRTEIPPHLVPAFNESTVKLASPIDDFLAGKAPVDPLEYSTDREVTDEQSELGIIAWRKLVDPENPDGGASVYLPIFDPKHFTEEQRDLIPKTGDPEHPELYVDHNGAVYRIAVLWMELDETPAAWGQPGVGKTEVGRHLAWLMQIPFYRFSIKESTEVSELEGAKEFDPERGTWFRDGRFTKAWAQTCVIVVDEPNLGRPEVWAYLRPAFDNSRQLVIEPDGGRNVTRGAYCFPLLAMNPAWSPLNVGTAQIGAADASRLMHVKFDMPEEKIERSIIKSRVRLDGWEIDEGRLNLLMKVSTALRELSDNSTLMMTWGIRENIKVARALRWFGPVTAYRMAAADYLEPEQEQIVLDQVRAATPSGGFKAPVDTEEGPF